MTTFTPQSLNDVVKHYESSGGDYTAQNPTSTAGGAYGFLNSTWNRYAAVVAPSYVDLNASNAPGQGIAAHAPAAVQDAVFAQAVSQRGLADWTCPGCDAPLANYVSSNPGVASLPVSSSGDGGGGTVDFSVSPAQTGNVSNNPAGLDPFDPFGLTQQGGAITGDLPGSRLNPTPGVDAAKAAAGGSSAGWLERLFQALANLATRGFIIVIAAVIIGVGLWSLINKQKVVKVAAGAARAAKGLVAA